MASNMNMLSQLPLQRWAWMFAKAPLRAGAAISFALLIGCAGAPERPADQTDSVPWPDFPAPKAGEVAFRVDPDASELRIRVDPEGPMARLGHSHIIGGHVVHGTVVAGPRPSDTRIDIRIDATALEVDRPEWRAREGLKPELDASAVNGTLANMRGEGVLDVQRHPEISIRSTAIRGPEWLPDIRVRIRLRGVVREIEVPVAVERNHRRIIASGAFELLQSDFGIAPFSAAGGALRVSDRMGIRFRIVATAGQ